MKFKSTLLAGLLGLSLLAPGAGLAQTPDTPAETTATAQIRLYPSAIRQGEPFRVDFTPPEQAQGPFRLSLAGQNIGLFEQNGHYLCYVSLPADQKPGGYTLAVSEPNGQIVASQKVELQRVPRSTQYITFYSAPLTAAQQKQLAAEDKLVDDALALHTPEQFWQGPFSRPVPHTISSYYGMFRYLNGKYNGYHGGIDFLTPGGYPIKAPAAGRIGLARYFSPYNSNGNFVLIDHGFGVTSLYLHISKILVKDGQMVKKGEPIALVGSSGRSTGPHLHWGVYINGKNTDALKWISFTENP